MSRFHPVPGFMLKKKKGAILIRQDIPCCFQCYLHAEDALVVRPGVHLATEMVKDLSSQVRYFGQRSGFKMSENEDIKACLFVQ